MKLCSTHAVAVAVRLPWREGEPAEALLASSAMEKAHTDKFKILILSHHILINGAYIVVSSTVILARNGGTCA